MISANQSESIVPMVYKHHCVEKIYVLELADHLTGTWLSMFEKIRYPYSDTQLIYEEIINDIKGEVGKKVFWNRFFSSFTMLHTQQLYNRHSVVKASADMHHNEFIVILSCNN